MALRAGWFSSSRILTSCLWDYSRSSMSDNESATGNEYRRRHFLDSNHDSTSPPSWKDVTCLPKPATTWWRQNAIGPIEDTIFSIGPITCPQDYYTASVSAKDASSTFVACCPIDYDFVTFLGPGNTGECTSEVKQGDIVTYATSSTDWKVTSSTVTEDTTVAAIPVNGWQFATPTGDSAYSTGSCAASVSEALANAVASGNASCDAVAGGGISPGAAAGIGVGVSLGVMGLAALGAGLFMMYRTRKAAQRRPVAAQIAKFSNTSGKDMNTSTQVFPTYSPVPRETPSPYERPQYQHEPDAWGVSAPVLTQYQQQGQQPSQLDTHTGARIIPRGELDGTSYQHLDARTRRRMELEGTPFQDMDGRTMGAGLSNPSHQDAEEETRRRMELEGEFDRNVKVSLSTPWLASARPVPQELSSHYQPPY
ncbi:hypothetical protein M426DRAFT_7027 [Hypoxylon sp. CI-4A]|nr:hypothetical protein M426DRAFT_7027 [Hypoxylon sp. CI-4A]